MFTVIAMWLLERTYRSADQAHVVERDFYEIDDRAVASKVLLHARQDLRLIAYLLSSILVALGVLGDIIVAACIAIIKFHH
jgi:hypothetical protein